MPFFFAEWTYRTLYPQLALNPNASILYDGAAGSDHCWR